MRIDAKMAVRNFSYDGFAGQLLEGTTSYLATFVSWTRDPGVAVCACTDGVERRIPSFALVDFDERWVAPPGACIQDWFGIPCSSLDGAN